MDRPAPKRRLEWWHYAILAFLCLQAFFYVVPQFRPGLPGVVCWLFGSDRILWPGIGLLLGIVVLIWSLIKRPFFTRWRWLGLGLLLLLMISPFAFRNYPSSHDDSPSAVRFRVPLDGPVKVGWGGGTPNQNYHVVAPDQCWAYDLVVTEEGSTHRGEGGALEDYYCYGMPVLAPADGTVHTVYTEAEDMPVGVLGGSPPTGNHIVLEVAPDEYLFLCHLKPGSIRVKIGDTVTRGQPLAQVGNSGNTSEPHLHIHLQDSAMPFIAEGIPLYFYNYRVDGEAVVERGIPTGGAHWFEWTGQMIENME